jgi:hypothetical protein
MDTKLCAQTVVLFLCCTRDFNNSLPGETYTSTRLEISFDATDMSNLLPVLGTTL